jgi:hypothetical protein
MNAPLDATKVKPLHGVQLSLPERKIEPGRVYWSTELR